MNAVWSFWSKPFFAFHKHAWASEKHHLLSCILSFQTARKHFHKTALFTDEKGARMLIEGLGLEFDTVSTELNALRNHDPKWWALGKLYTYRLQTEPFIHIDSDVFFWKLFPVNSEATLWAQNPEVASCYMPERFEAVIRKVPGGWLPTEWEWYRSREHAQRAGSCGICCGVFGGSHMDFIRYYANLAMQIVGHPVNQKACSGLSAAVERNILVEQYLLAACIEYHKYCPNSVYKNLDIQYLFRSMNDAFNPQKAAEVGYTHLMGATKKDQKVAGMVERRVMKDYPEDYERCIRYLQDCNSAKRYSA
jgi:hypothetical protein